MVPRHYAMMHSAMGRRIFVVISDVFGDFVLTKTCAGPECGCIGCAMLSAVVEIEGVELPVLNLDASQTVGENLTAYSFTTEGDAFLYALEGEYKPYKGSFNKAKLDELFKLPDALVIIKNEGDGTFTHSYISPTVEKRVISRGCRATRICPCVGCRIVDMWYMETPDSLVPAIDFSKRRATKEGELILPIFEGEEIISKMLNRDPAVRHSFSPTIFDSPLEQMFYELAFLDLHLYPQHQVGKYRLDFAIPDKRVAIELDGHEYHKTKFQRTNDAQRDRWLYGQGWHVLRFTGTEIHKDLDRCINEICKLVGVERLSRYGSSSDP